MTMVHTTIASGASILPVDTSTTLLQPAAKGSLQCCCSGEVIEMSGKYGWLMAHGTVDHHLAGQRRGHVYVSSRDVVDGSWLQAGDTVCFYLYVDGQGLGAEGVRLQQRTPTKTDSTSGYVAAQFNNWQKASSWGNSKWGQYQPVQLVPVGYAMTTSLGEQCRPCAERVAEAPVELTEDGLPSKGSVGHEDGSCKRCAFHSKGRCQNGIACDHCHYDHTDRCRVRKHGGKRNVAQAEHVEWIKDVHAQSWEVETTAPSGASDDEATAPSNTSDEEGSPSTPSLGPSSPPVVPASPSRSAISDDESVYPCSSAWSVHSDNEETGSECGDETAFETLMDCEPQQKQPQQQHMTLPSFADFLKAAPLAPTHGKRSSFCESSPTSWAAQQRLRKTSTAAAGDDVSRMARALLNKLTQDRFESLSDQIVALPICNTDQLGSLAAEIFEKATTQDGFRSLYTKLCMRLDAHFSEQAEAVGGKAFRKALAAECQKTFEGYLQPFDASKFQGLKRDEIFEAEMKQKTRRLGNMRFIGELLSCRLLAHKLMPPIILELLHSDEAALESLIALLTVVAPFFEQQSGASPCQASLRDAFSTLRRRKTDKCISSRLRCQLCDLFDAKGRGWTSRSV